MYVSYKTRILLRKNAWRTMTSHVEVEKKIVMGQFFKMTIIVMADVGMIIQDGGSLLRELLLLQ